VSFSDFDVDHRTRKDIFLNQIDRCIDWTPIEKTISEHYAPASDVTERLTQPSSLAGLATHLEFKHCGNVNA
jgi:IS5 family transposase